MSDFLRKLVERSLNAEASALRPRLPSLYEPNAPALAQTSWQGEFEFEHSADDAHARGEENTREPLRGTRNDARIRPAETTGARGQTDNQTFDEREQLRARATVVAPRNDAAESPRQTSADATARGASVETRAESSAKSDSRPTDTRRLAPDASEETPRRVGERSSSAEGLRRVAEELMSRAGNEEAIAEEETRAESRLSARRVVAPEAIVVRPVIEPPRVEKPAGAESSAPDAGPSIVRVHIGRVEVRATRSAEPTPVAPRRAHTGPALSLEDYLKQRKGGRG